MIIGHRGARREAPENTLGGFRYLVDLGIRATEFDIRLSADHKLMIIHDSTCQRTSGMELSVECSQSAQLRELSHTREWPQWGAPEPTPFLAEVLDICQSFEHIELEVKQVASMDAARLLVTHLLKQLEQLPPRHTTQYTMTSFDLQIHHALVELDTDLPRGLLVENEVQLNNALTVCRRLGCNRIGVKESLLTQTYVDQIVSAGLALSAWTVNDITRAKRLWLWGVRDFITDIPSQFQSLFPT